MAVTTDGLFQYILNRVLCLEPRPLRLEYRRLRSAATECFNKSSMEFGKLIKFIVIM